MEYIIALFILVNSCLQTKAQFHTIASWEIQEAVQVSSADYVQKKWDAR